jgi:predicted GIY-YIG superfamily endonuclease
MTVTCGVYQIVNLINNKKYIGSSNNLKIRKCTHFADIKNERTWKHIEV